MTLEKAEDLAREALALMSQLEDRYKWEPDNSAVLNAFAKSIRRFERRTETMKCIAINTPLNQEY